MGTPKTLRQAIINGLKQAQEQKLTDDSVEAEIIRAHVIDFLAQRFGAAMMNVADAEDLKDLYAKIIKAEK